MAGGGNDVGSGTRLTCNICEEVGLREQADQFCVSCQQYLCEECKQHHSRAKPTKSHQVIGTDEIPSLSSLTLGSDSNETPLCKDHESAIKYFCISHMTELCQSCRLMEHKQCANVTKIEKASCDMFTEEHSIKILKSMEDMKDIFSKCKSTAQRNRDMLYSGKQSAIDTVKQARINIDSHLDKIETAAYDEIGRVFRTKMKQVEDQLHVCDVSMFQLQKRISKIERAMMIADKEAEFITINAVTKEVKRQCNLLKDTIEGMCDIDFTFIVRDSIGKISELLSSLGTASITTYPASQSDSGTVAIYTDELKTNTKTDTMAPFIRSYEKLSDGRYLIADATNQKMKLYDSNKQFISELAIPDYPMSVVVLCDTEAVVSLPFIETLQYITIGTDLALAKTKKVNYQPCAMVKYGNDILATVSVSFFNVAVIDKHGNVKRTIYRDNGSLFSAANYINVSIDRKAVYVVDADKGCIGLSMDGNVMFQYQDQKVKIYGGLAVGRDCLFIGVDRGNDMKVRRLSLNGDDAEDLDLGFSRPLKIKDNNMIIVTRDGKNNRLINVLYTL